MANLQPIRGTHDLLPADFQRYNYAVSTARRVASLYGFEEIATPILEFKEVFKRTLGNESDIVSKEMYEIADRGGEQIVLRPEGTAGVARAIISNGLTQSLPLKYFYEGPMFRYERPQKGRLRQLHQFGVELFGIAEPIGDVEVIALAADVLRELGLLEHTNLEINTLGDDESRGAYRKELVTYLNDHHAVLSPDSQRRLQTNPLRILDTKDENDKRILKEAPLLKDSLNAASQDMFAQVLEGLRALDINFEINSHLVRGLDYYCHVAFEFTTTELGSQGTVLAGGRYDKLVSIMGGPSIPGTGWAAGADRLAMMLENREFPSPRPVAVIPMDTAHDLEGLKLAQTLRKQKIPAQVICGGNLGKRLKKTNKINAQFALILGEEELKHQNVVLKELDSGEQHTFSIEQAISFIKEKGA